MRRSLFSFAAPAACRAFLAAWLVGLLVSSARPAHGATGNCNPGSFTASVPAVLHHPQITLIFWGAGWPSPAGSPTAGQIGGAITELTNGPFFSRLAQYRDEGGPAGIPRVVPGIHIKNDTSPPPTFNTGDIGGMLQTEFTKNTIPRPNSSVENIYAVILPPGLTHNPIDIPCAGNVVGCHWVATDPNGNRVFFAWVMNNGTMNVGQSVTSIFSHEIAETITSPGTNTQLSDPNKSEIGDVCTTCFQSLNANLYTVQSYYSVADRRCVAPIGWRGVAQYAGNGNWTLFGGPVRQIVAGGAGVVATDNTDPPQTWMFTPSAGWKVVLTGSAHGNFSQLAISDTTAYGVAIDQGSVWRFFGGTVGVQGWFPLSVFGETGVWAGGQDTVLTMSNKFLFKWDPVAVNWGTEIAYAPNEVAVNETGVFMLAMNHDTVSQLNADNATWTKVGPGFADIFAGPNLVTGIGFDGYAYNFQPSTATWWQNVPPRYSYASITAPGLSLPQLLSQDSSPNGKLYQSTNVFAKLPVQNVEPLTAGRLVGGSNNGLLLATIDPGCSPTPNATCQ
jgi:hypothetical protein